MTAPQPIKEKAPFYKQAWFWIAAVVAGAGVCFLAVMLFGVVFFAHIQGASSRGMAHHERYMPGFNGVHGSQGRVCPPYPGDKHDWEIYDRSNSSTEEGESSTAPDDPTYLLPEGHPNIDGFSNNGGGAQGQ